MKIKLFSHEKEKQNQIFSCIICVIIASLPLFMDYLIVGHDLVFHLNRIEGLYEGLKCNFFPVKIQPLWFNEYGYPIGVFYGDWVLYIPAFFKFLGFSVQRSYQMFVIIINIFTVVISNYCFTRLFKRSDIGYWGAIIYTLSLYRLENVYSRAAVGEYCAMIFFPMIFVGMYEILFEKYKENKFSPRLLLVFGLVGVIHTHILSCLMAAFFIIITCVVFYKKTFKPSIFIKLCSVVVLTFLLSIDFLVPFLNYYTMDYFTITSDTWEWGKMLIQGSGLFLNQIFSVFVNPQGASMPISEGASNEITFSLGLPVIIGVVLYIYTLINITSDNKAKDDHNMSFYAFIMFVLCVSMSTCYFPWDIIANTHNILHSLVSTIQFPWRFLSPASLFSTIFICYTLKYSNNIFLRGQKYLPVITVIFSILLSSFWYMNGMLFNEEYGVQGFYYSKDDLNIREVITGEYLPDGTVGEKLTNGLVVASENVRYSNYNKQQLYITCFLETKGEEGYLEVPLLYYKGYRASDINTGLELEVKPGNNNVVRIEFPKDYSGSIKVEFREPILWRFSEFITILSFLLILMHFLLRFRKEKL